MDISKASVRVSIFVKHFLVKMINFNNNRIIKLFFAALIVGMVFWYFYVPTKKQPINKIHNVRFTQCGDPKEADVLIVGAGLSGVVLAHLHATILKKRVLIIEKRDHIGGNCYDYINEHGIRVSRYGAHLFHTNDESVWRYLSQFSKWIPYEHRVVGKVDGDYVPIPVNIDTVNAMFSESLKTTIQMQKWLKEHQVHNDNPQNGEEAAKARVGQILFEKLFKGYTYKQWNKYPNELDASVLQRIPVRDNFDDRYFPNDIYQALPADGYTSLIASMLNHHLITVALNCDFLELQRRRRISVLEFSKTFFTGPIDSYFSSSGLEKLEYRSIRFETTHLPQQVFQPNVVVNYPQGPEKFTRIVEYKHLYNQESTMTTIVKEFSQDFGDPYYPVLNERNRNIYAKYAGLAKDEEKKYNVYFVGRLASYKYFNMDQAVLNAINQFKRAYSHISFSDEQLFPVSLSDANYVFAQKHQNPSISFIINHCKQSLYWINKKISLLCKTHDIHIFLYEKCADTDKGAKLVEQYPECNIHQRVMLNYGGLSHTWLYHIMVKQFMFADLNVFLDEGKVFETNGLFKLLDKMKTAHHEFKSKFYLDTETEGLVSHHMTFSDLNCFDQNVPNVGITRREFLNKTCDYFYSITKTRQDCLNFLVNPTGEFIVTDVLLRRILARHRKALMGWYNHVDNSQPPIESYVLKQMWALLFRHPSDYRC